MILSHIVQAFLGAFAELYYELSLMKPRYNKAVCYIGKFFFTAVGLVVTNAFLNRPFVKFSLSFFCLVIYYLVFFNAKIINKAINAAVFYLCMAVTEISGMLIMSQIVGVGVDKMNSIESPLMCLFSLIFVGISFICFSVAIHVLKGKKIDKTYALIALYIITQIMFVLVLTNIMVYYNVNDLSVIIVEIGIISVSFGIGYLIEKSLTKNAEDKIQQEFLNNEIIIRDMHYSEMKKQYEQYRKLKHDFLNHIAVIDTLRSKNETERLTLYVDELKDSFENIEKVFYCSDPTVDALLFYKNKEAKEYGIRTKINVMSPEIGKITYTDICSIISNLFQNAIEACNRFDGEKYIIIDAFKKINQYVIIVKNSSIPVTSLETVKTDGKNHGIGLGIVRSIAERYNGNAIFEYKNNEFTSIVNLSI